MWLELEQIECLQAVKSSGSISAAAMEMNRAKSSIYYAIKKLEEQLGFQLVQSQQYRGSLTPKGEQFLKQAVKLLAYSTELKKSAHKIATGVEMSLAISASDFFPIENVNRVIKSLQKKYPDTELVFHREIMSGEKLLEQGEIDVAICESFGKYPRLEYKKISEVELILVISADHPFHQSEQKLENLFQFPQIVQRATIPNKDDSGGIFKQSKQWTVSDLVSKKQIIVDGLGWGRLPKHLISEELKSKKLISLAELDKPVKLPIYICRVKKSRPGKILSEIWESFN